LLDADRLSIGLESLEAISGHAPGETKKPITVVVKSDKKKEANENFFVDLSDLSGYALFLDSRGTGTIQNDD
jgi:hypothetical protein